MAALAALMATLAALHTHGYTDYEMCNAHKCKLFRAAHDGA